jgi:hypothetical protein
MLTAQERRWSNSPAEACGTGELCRLGTIHVVGYLGMLTRLIPIIAQLSTVTIFDGDILVSITALAFQYIVIPVFGTRLPK